MKLWSSDLGSLGASILSTIWWIGPLLLAGLGGAGSGLAASFSPYRVFFVPLAFVFLGLSWYLALSRRPVRRRILIRLVLVSGAALLFIFFSYYRSYLGI